MTVSPTVIQYTSARILCWHDICKLLFFATPVQATYYMCLENNTILLSFLILLKCHMSVKSKRLSFELHAGVSRVGHSYASVSTEPQQIDNYVNILTTAATIEDQQRLRITSQVYERYVHSIKVKNHKNRGA